MLIQEDFGKSSSPKSCIIILCKRKKISTTRAGIHPLIVKRQ